jgi:hypothetical protein
VQVAAEIDRYVQDDAVDGFILGSYVSPAGLDEVVEKVVPLLRDRGVLRDRYTGSTLRENLGLRPPAGLGEPSADRTAARTAS